MFQNLDFFEMILRATGAFVVSLILTRFNYNHLRVSLEDVFYVKLQEDGTLYIDKRKDNLQGVM